MFYNNQHNILGSKIAEAAIQRLRTVRKELQGVVLKKGGGTRYRQVSAKKVEKSLEAGN